MQRAHFLPDEVESLKGMIEKYALVGIDVDYEEGLENGAPTFAPAVGELLRQLKEWRGDLVTTIAPFTLVRRGGAAGAWHCVCAR